MDDFFDDFDNDFDGGSDEDGDEGECDDDFSDLETDGDDDDTTFETTDGSWDFPREKDWSIIGPLSEELSRERREREWLKRKSQEKS